MRRFCFFAIACASASCTSAPPPADLLLLNARVYTLAWPAPDGEGRPASGAPHDSQGWRPDADAIAIRAGQIVFVGAGKDADRHRGAATEVRDLAGATVFSAPFFPPSRACEIRL